MLTFVPASTDANDDPEEDVPDPPGEPYSSPSFAGFGVDYETGWNDTTFCFWLNFSSNEEPINIIVQVYVDYVGYDMFENDTKDDDWTDGKDYYWMNMERLWSKGLIPYFFYTEINGTDNTSETGYFEILNRAPYILSPPPMTIYVDEVVTYKIRVQDDDLDPIDGDLIAHNFTGADWWWIEWYPDNLTWVGKPKQEFVRWLNITIWDSYGQLAWYRWTITCVEGDGGGDTLPSPKWFPEVPIWR
jgi:hypothetical protein